MAEELKKRSEAAKETTWATEDLYASDALWEADFEKAQEMIAAADQFRGHLADSAEVLYSYLKEQERQSLMLDSLSSYASRKHDEDTAEPIYQAMRSRMMSFYTKLGTAYAFAEPELVEIPEETYKEFYRQKPQLEEYRRYIDNILRMKPHTLSQREEELVAAASEAFNVAAETFSVLNDADLVFPVILDGEGKEVRITHGNYTRLMESKNREVRKSAFEAVYSVYNQFKNTFASLIYGQVKKQMFYAQQFHYGSTMERALFHNEVPITVYKNLIESVHANMDKMYRYVALRKKLLGVDELHMYDVYTPIVSGIDMEIPFDEAK
ncbi:MAG: oligoendopeptidase F, partial [Lachnospiraceae bacterium]|nr:oligoendopeptidase F [Lachnospiraceae bacterium]